MMGQITALIVDESKWLTVSMGLALLAVGLVLYRHRTSTLPLERRLLAAMNLFFGVTIGTMAFGHLLAVSTKLALGTLEGPVPVLYAIGAALVLPSAWLVLHVRKLLSPGGGELRATLYLNAWTALTLLVLGPQNLPLAAPALFNISYQLNSNRIVGWAIVGAAVVTNLALFIGSLVFFATGQSFEQFSAIR